MNAKKAVSRVIEISPANPRSNQLAPRPVIDLQNQIVALRSEGKSCVLSLVNVSAAVVQEQDAAKVARREVI
jgi:hypothetical protein